MEKDEKFVKLGREDVEAVSGGSDEAPSYAPKPLYEIGEKVYLMNLETYKNMVVTIFDRYWYSYVGEWRYKMSGDNKNYDAPESAIIGRA